jgi:hypothetical protein
MNLDLFAVPFFIGNIDLKNIKLDAEIGEAWLSRTPSSKNEKNHLDPESSEYLMDVLLDLLGEKFTAFSISLQGNVWRNEYLDKDWQEPHVHLGAQFSFIIYEKVSTPHTIFFNPAKYLISGTLQHQDCVLREFTPSVTAGQIVIFPSYVEHMVNRNSDQVTISGNINFKFMDIRPEDQHE